MRPYAELEPAVRIEWLAALMFGYAGGWFTHAAYVAHTRRQRRSGFTVDYSVTADSAGNGEAIRRAREQASRIEEDLRQSEAVSERVERRLRRRSLGNP